MQITYLYHSGFIVQFNSVNVLIDYYSPHADTPEPALVQALADPARKLYVLSSHAHHDHYDPRILRFESACSDTTFVFSSDIDAGSSANIHYVDAQTNHTFDDGGISIRAFGSTDAGVSFLIRAEDRTVFHAGDLNNWHWNEESSPEESAQFEANYLAELEKLAAFAPSVDAAMFPADPRLGKGFAKGAEQFAAKIRTAHMLPMHFGERHSEANSAKPAIEQHGTTFCEVLHKGQVFQL